MKKLMIGAVVALGTLSLAACGVPSTPQQSATPTAAAPGSLDGHWILLAAHDAAGDVDLSMMDVPFTFEDGYIKSQICNPFGGDFTMNGTMVTIGELYTNEMYCTKPAGIMDFEKRIMDDLAQVNNATITDGILTLSGGDVEFTLDVIG